MIPLVSVVVITYQHKNYIKQCLDEVLNQKTSFDFEIIIGEDESTDGTREICIEYAAKYPNKIKLFLRSRKDVIQINGYPTGRFNFIECLKVSKGKYIALCEGDDYWTDEKKLQKQVDFLEANTDYSVCFHRANMLKEGNIELHKIPSNINNPVNYQNLISHFNFITFASVVFKNSIKNFPDWFYRVPYGDMAIYNILSRTGKIGYIDEIMSVYRINQNGIWSSLSEFNKLMNDFRFSKIIYPFLNNEERMETNKKVKQTIQKMATLKFPFSINRQRIYKRVLLLKFKL